MPFIWVISNVELWIAYSNMIPPEILKKGGFFVKQLEPVIHLGFANIMKNILVTSSLVYFLILIYTVYAKSDFRFKIFMIFNLIMLVGGLITVFFSISDFSYYPGLFTALLMIIPFSLISILIFKKAEILKVKDILKIYLPIAGILYFPITALIWYLGVQISKLI